MPFYTTAILSANQELTPEGFLLCRNVPIARTGQMLYLPQELLDENGKQLVAAGPDGIVRIERTDEHVFSPATIASFEAKAVTLDHPMMNVAPGNWSQIAKGITQNVRRGQGVESDLLLADLLITDATAIEQVRNGLREVSCGYNAEYEQTAPGYGLQTDIVGNHVALVEKGRCGSRCAIGDSHPMQKKLTFFDRIRAAWKARDEAAFEKELSENPTADSGEETEEEKKKREAEEAEAAKTSDALTQLTATVDGLNTRLAAIEARDAKRTKDGDDETEEEKKKREAEEAAAAAKTGDADPEETDEQKAAAADKKTRDSAALFATAADVFARAEILSPGLSLPTRDAAADPVKFNDSLCALRRQALANAAAGTFKDAVKPLVTGVDIQTLTCDALNAAFIGASEIVRRENNAQTTLTFDSGQKPVSILDTIRSMNNTNAKFWSRQ